MNLLSMFSRRPGRRRTTALERRLARRAMLYWCSIGGDGALAAVGAFNPSALEDDISMHGFMLDLRDPEGPMVCHLGPVLREEAEVAELPVSLADVSERSLLGQFALRWLEVLAQEQPVTADYDFDTDSHRILCRGALLPLSSDGLTIDHVYGVVSWRREKLPRAGVL